MTLFQTAAKDARITLRGKAGAMETLLIIVLAVFSSILGTFSTIIFWILLLAIVFVFVRMLRYVCTKVAEWRRLHTPE